MRRWFEVAGFALAVFIIATLFLVGLDTGVELLDLWSP